MKYRVLGKTGYKVSEISIGTWQLGGKWGELFDKTAVDSVFCAIVLSNIYLLLPPNCHIAIDIS